MVEQFIGILLLLMLCEGSPVRFGDGGAELHLDDRRVVLAPRVVIGELGHAMVWCWQDRGASGVLDRCALGRMTEEAARVSRLPLLADDPGCGGLGRIAHAAGARGEAVVAAVCQEPGHRAVHAGLAGGPLYGLPLREGSRDHGPVLVSASGGGYWLLWGSGPGEPSAVFRTVSEAVLAARLDSGARPVAGPFEVSGEGEAWMPWTSQLLDAVPLSGGGFAAAWYGIPRYGGHAVRVRIFDALGMPATGVIDIPLEEEGADSIRVAVDGSDRITVVWQARERGWWRVFAASFSAAGEPLVPPQVVGTEPRNVDLRLPRIASTKTGQILVWLERDSAGRSWIAARKWSAARGPVGLVTRVEAEVARRWAFLEVAPVDAAGGSFRIYWNPDGPDGLTVPARVRWRELVLAPGTM